MKPHKNQSAHHVKQSHPAVTSAPPAACTKQTGVAHPLKPIQSSQVQNRTEARGVRPWDASNLVQQGRPRWCSMATRGGSHPDNSTQTQQHTPSTPSAGHRHTHAWAACLAVSVSNGQCNRNGSRAVRLHKPTTSKQYSALLWGNPWLQAMLSRTHSQSITGHP